MNTFTDENICERYSCRQNFHTHFMSTWFWDFFLNEVKIFWSPVLGYDYPLVFHLKEISFITL